MMEQEAQKYDSKANAKMIIEYIVIQDGRTAEPRGTLPEQQR